MKVLINSCYAYSMQFSDLEKDALRVLNKNDLGNWTQPAPGLYPHQWLWDSSFIAIGLRHIDIKRAQEEIRSLLRGQWENGMIPHIIFSRAEGYHAGPWLWQSHVNPNAPRGIETTGVTQPPVIAEAVVKIGDLLDKSARTKWYKEIFDPLARYHDWLYTCRDPENTGAVTVVHPWESGQDNTPPWMEIIHKYVPMEGIEFLEKAGLEKFIDRFRKDTSVVPPDERMSTHDLYSVYRIARQLHHHKYEDEKMLKNQKTIVADLSFNCILVRATKHLADIANFLGEDLPPRVEAAFARGTTVLEQFWDKQTDHYYSIDRYTAEQIRVQSIGTFMPLYAGKLEESRKKSILKHLTDPMSFGTEYPIPSAPVKSKHFMAHRYWQGPVWINMNWMIIDGLMRNDEPALAGRLRETTIGLVENGGMNEYFSTLDGSPAGVADFSWTAALTIDLLRNP